MTDTSEQAVTVVRGMDWIRDHAREHLDKRLGPLKRPFSSLPENGGSYRAGADWTPHRPPYDVDLPITPVSYTEEDKLAQREAGEVFASSRDTALSCVWDSPACSLQRFEEVPYAGKQLVQTIKDAIEGGQSVLEVPRGVYRLSEAGEDSSGPLMLCNSTNFTLKGPGAELLVENGGGHARLLENTNLTICGRPQGQGLQHLGPRAYLGA